MTAPSSTGRHEPRRKLEHKPGRTEQSRQASAAGLRTPQGQRLPIDDSLFFKLARLVNLTARPFVETLSRRHQLSLNEWRVMVVLASHPGLAAHEVAEATGLDKMSVSRAIAGLARRSRVIKRDDAADKRRSLLELSADGRRLYKTIGSAAIGREAQLFAGVGAAEQAQLGAWVDRLTAAVLRSAQS